MPKLSKRQQAIQQQVAKAVPAAKQLTPAEALAVLKDLPKAKFNESVDVSVNLGVDARQSDQTVRGSVVLPHGTGRTVRVAVFTNPTKAKEAQDAGADLVGMDDLAEKVKAGEINFDVAIASPDAMKVIGSLAQILGPRGLMPNPKVGTVTMDVAKAVKDAKSGQVQFRIDKAGIIHCPIGKLDFSVEALSENLATLLGELKKKKPASSKGIYFKKVTLSSTMGPGLPIDFTKIVA